MIRKQGGSVLYIRTKFQWVALFLQKLLGGSQNTENSRSRDRGHAYLGVVLYSVRRDDPFSIMSVPNFRWG